MKHIILKSWIVLPLILLTGCSTSTAGGRRLPVSAVALSKTDSGYHMTAEIIRQDSLDGDATPYYLITEGDTLTALFELADRNLGGQFYFSQAQTILLDENVALDSITPIVDFLCARTDARLTMRVAIVTETSSHDLLEADSLTGQIPGVSLSDMLDNLAANGELPDEPLYLIYDHLLAKTAFSVPALTLTKDKHASPFGSAVFRSDRLSHFEDVSS